MLNVFHVLVIRPFSKGELNSNTLEVQWLLFVPPCLRFKNTISAHRFSYVFCMAIGTNNHYRPMIY